MGKSDRYYLRYRGRTNGPYDVQEVKQMILRGKVTRLHEVSTDGTTWQRVGKCEDLLPAASPQVQAHPAQDKEPSQNSPGNAKQRTPQPSASTGATMPAVDERGYTIQMAPDITALESASPAAPRTLQWHYAVNDAQVGPVPQAALEQILRSGQLDGKNLVWREGMPRWLPVEQTELATLIPAAMAKAPELKASRRKAKPAASSQAGQSNLDADELTRAVHSAKTYTGHAFGTLAAYLFFWPAGLICNIIFLCEAKDTMAITGTAPSGRGCLVAMLWVFVYLPAAFFLVLFAFFLVAEL